MHCLIARLLRATTADAIRSASISLAPDVAHSLGLRAYQNSTVVLNFPNVPGSVAQLRKLSTYSAQLGKFNRVAML